MNFIGLFTTDLIEIAAPPRVSPSNFVRITPSTGAFITESFKSIFSFTDAFEYYTDVNKRIYTIYTFNYSLLLCFYK